MKEQRQKRKLSGRIEIFAQAGSAIRKVSLKISYMVENEIVVRNIYYPVVYAFSKNVLVSGKLMSSYQEGDCTIYENSSFSKRFGPFKNPITPYPLFIKASSERNGSLIVKIHLNQERNEKAPYLILLY